MKDLKEGIIRNGNNVQWVKEKITPFFLVPVFETTV